MPQTQHTARKTGGDDASKTRSDASGRDDTAAAHASKKEKLLYNLKNHVYAQQFRSIHVPGEVGIVPIRLYQIKQMLSYSATFQKIRK